jgi:hypothetical protein
MRGYSGSFTTPIVIIVLAAVAVIAIGAWAVLGAESCLTKEQARARWPGTWLYWHTAQRCWDNQRGSKTGQNRAVQVVHSAQQVGKPPIEGNGDLGRQGSRPIAVEKSPTIFYPDLIAGGGTTNNMLYPHTVASWSPITDFDSDPPPFLPWARVSAAFNR